MRTDDRIFHRTFDATAPLILWALHFFAAYIFAVASCDTTLADALWLDRPLIWMVLLAWTIVVLPVAAFLLWRAVVLYLMAPRQLLSGARLGCAVLGAIGIVWTAVPMLILSVCSQ